MDVVNPTNDPKVTRRIFLRRLIESVGQVIHDSRHRKTLVDKKWTAENTHEEYMKNIRMYNRLTRFRETGIFEYEGNRGNPEFIELSVWEIKEKFRKFFPDEEEKCNAVFPDVIEQK